MLFQLDYYRVRLILSVIIRFVFPIIIAVIGIFLTRWYAKKKEWSDSLLTAFIVNLIWLLTNIPISLLVVFLFGANFLSEHWVTYFLFGIVELVIAIIIGAIVVKIIYKKEFGESFVFVIVVKIVLFLIATLILIVPMSLGFGAPIF